MDEDVALGIERHGPDGRPIAGLPAPAPWIALPGCLVERVALSERGPILPGMALRGGDVADAAVSVLMIVPMGKAHGPFPGGLQIGKSRGGEVGPILARSEERLSESIDAPISVK